MKMKKIYIAAALLLAASAGAGAQNLYDAITFSQNHYSGTARSMAMGNAVTALGGDIGSIVINPAGSAVARYGQFVVTPGLTISSVNSSYSPEGETAYAVGNRLNHTRVNLPSIGVSFKFETGRRSGVKSFSFAILSTQTNSYNSESEGFGTNRQTSKIAEFADAAYGIPESSMAGYNSFNTSSVSWDILSAYNGGMFGPYGQDGVYAGVTETIADDGSYHYVPGALTQTSILSKRGSKNDLLINMGLNISDRVYVGFNVGLPNGRYRYAESFYEAAADPGQFPIIFQEDKAEYLTYFNKGTSNYQYTADIGGIYAKLGVIVRPLDGLRLGASFQTPTALTISESWQYSAATVFSDTRYNDSVTSPVGEYSYTLRSPYRASFGAAYAFGYRGLLSVDYELADYSVMRFDELRRNRMNGNGFEVQNWLNRNFAGVSHAVRVGGELKLTPEWALRAGYTLTTSPERWWTDSDGRVVNANTAQADADIYFNRIKNLVTPHYYNDKTQSFSLGFGYSSPGSFFADAVVRCTSYPAATFSPYYDYDSYDRSGNLLSVPAPRILNERRLWNVAVTFGWRF